MKMRFALAVNHANFFEQKHFGEAEKFLIYEWEESQLVLLQSIDNPFANTDYNQHSTEKAEQIISLLKEYDIDVLVSKQFGGNIKKINAFFVPVQIGYSSPEELFPILKKQMKWIEEELLYNAGNFKLFNLKRGTIKTPINREK